MYRCEARNVRGGRCRNRAVEYRRVATDNGVWEYLVCPLHVQAIYDRTFRPAPGTGQSISDDGRELGVEAPNMVSSAVPAAFEVEVCWPVGEEIECRKFDYTARSPGEAARLALAAAIGAGCGDAEVVDVMKVRS